MRQELLDSRFLVVAANRLLSTGNRRTHPELAGFAEALSEQSASSAFLSGHTWGINHFVKP